MNSDFSTVTYDVTASGVARIMLNRPERRNAQNHRLLYELNAAFDLAAQDDSVKVIILSGAGPHFSAGHDLRDPGPIPGEIEDYPPICTWGGFSLPGAEGWMAVEEEIYLGMSRRWRSIPKPTIAQVHGQVIMGGLMLMWVCDLIVASDDASFRDFAVDMGVCGVEWFAHPWELGARKAKEMLFTGEAISAADAHRLGMLNHVVPRDELESFTDDLALRIARQPTFALKLAKEAVNQTLDAQGQMTAIQGAFSLHQIAHSHNERLFGSKVNPAGLNEAVRNRPGSYWEEAKRVVPAGADEGVE